MRERGADTMWIPTQKDMFREEKAMGINERFVEELERRMSEALAIKTGWGRREIMLLWRQCLSGALASALDAKERSK